MYKKIYCDGSCLGNPGHGGWAFFVVEESQMHSGHELNTTNNRMELLAACKAIEYAGDCMLFTDSKYLTLGITEWLQKWKKNGWKTSTKAPVKNCDLWIRLDLLVGSHKVCWEWVKGHDPLNKIHNSVDVEARKQATLIKDRLL